MPLPATRPFSVQVSAHREAAVAGSAAVAEVAEAKEVGDSEDEVAQGEGGVLPGSPDSLTSFAVQACSS